MCKVEKKANWNKTKPLMRKKKINLQIIMKKKQNSSHSSINIRKESYVFEANYGNGTNS